MADTKLSDLTELAVEPADTDQFYINDGGTSKCIAWSVIKTAGTSDATATAADILSGETAYVNGVKLTGTAALREAISDVALGRWATSHALSNAGKKYLVEANNGARYEVYIDQDSDVKYRKSTDDGLHWGEPVIVFTGTATQLSISYDRWSGLATDLIHCAYTESGGNDTLYRAIDTGNSDALGTETTIFNGASQTTNGYLSITRARGGNLYCHAMIDSGAEGGFFRSTDVGATWGSRTLCQALSTTDQIILLPGFAADNQDIMAIFYDVSLTKLIRYVHDDSADSWAGSDIGSVTLASNGTNATSFDAFVDLTNSRIVLFAWNATDAANADLNCWTITESAITAKTDVVLNSGDDQGCVAAGIDTATGYWYCFYAGKSDGSETAFSDVNLYYKVSTDQGATWGAETRANDGGFTLNLFQGLWTMPRFTAPWQIVYALSGANTITVQPTLFYARAA